MLTIQSGLDMLNKLRRMRTLEDDDDDTGAKGAHSTGTTQQPAWMRLLLSNCNEWLAMLPSVCFHFMSKLDQSSIFVDCHASS